MACLQSAAYIVHQKAEVNVEVQNFKQRATRIFSRKGGPQNENIEEKKEEKEELPDEAGHYEEICQLVIK